MDAKELENKMMKLIPDAPTSLRLRDPAANSWIYISKETLIEGDEDDDDLVSTYYRIRINGYEGTRCELVPDVVEAADEWLKMYTRIGGRFDTQQLAGRLNVRNWEAAE